MVSFAKVMPDRPCPTCTLPAGAPLTAHPYLKPFRQPYQDVFGGCIVMLHPESRGELVLSSADAGHTDPHPAELHVDRARVEACAPACA